MSFHPRFPKERLEFSQTATRNGIDNTIPPHLEANAARLSYFLADLEILLQTKGLPSVIQVTSGYRCEQLNRAVGGARNSDHMEARAADIVVPRLTPFDLATIVKSEVIDRVDQVILEFGRWTHVSIAPTTRSARMQPLTAKKINGVTKYLPGIVP